MSATSNNFRLVLKLVIALAVVVAGVAVVIVSLRPVAVVEPVVSADAIDAKPGSVTVVQEFSEDLKSEAGGRILRTDYNLDPGKAVQPGQVLARLDPADLLLVIGQKKIDYAAAKALFAADRSKELVLEAADFDLANARRLNKLGTLADSELTRVERAEKVAAQDVDLAKINNQKVLDTLANDLKIDERNLEKMTIRSSVAGTISQVYAHPGDLIAIEAPVATIISAEKVVEGKISEEDFAQVRLGEEANVTFLPYGDLEFEGTISKILPTADPETQRHLVQIAVKMDADHPLVPGINGEVIIVVGRRAAQTVVPRRAVFDLNGKNVYVVKNGVVELRKVSTGYLWSRGAEVLTGLQPGEDVIVDELESFHPGDRVRVQELPSDVVKK